MPVSPAALSAKSKFLILSLLIINFQLLEYVPFSVGPISLTILLELCLIGVFLPDLASYLRTRHRRQTVLVMLVIVMTAQVFTGFRPDFALARFRLASVSLLFYVLTIVAFSHDERRGLWVRRLHLILGVGTIFLFFFQNSLVSLGDSFNLSVRLGGNFPPAYLAMLLPICWERLRHERGVFRWLNLLTIVGAFGVEVLSASRSGFICLAAALLFTTIWLSSGKARLAALTLIVAAAVVAAFVDVQSLGGSALIERVSSMRSPELAAVGRTELAEAAVLFISRHPWYGGDFRAEVFPYLLEVAPDSRISVAITDGFWDTQSGPHNGYLNVMAEHGIPVGVLFIAYFIWLFRDLFRAARTVVNRENRALLRAACVSLVVFGIFMLSDHSYWASNYFTLAAILECYLSLCVRDLAWAQRQAVARLPTNPRAALDELR